MWDHFLQKTYSVGLGSTKVPHKKASNHAGLRYVVGRGTCGTAKHTYIRGTHAREKKVPER